MGIKRENVIAQIGANLFQTVLGKFLNQAGVSAIAEHVFPGARRVGGVEIEIESGWKVGNKLFHFTHK